MRVIGVARPQLLAAIVAVVVCAVGPAAAGAAGPVLLTRPAAAGRSFTGEVVTLTPARWRTAADAVERRWLRCVVSSTGGCRPQDIPGATAVTYVIATADVGAIVYAAERAHDASGWSEWFTSNSPGQDAAPQGISPRVLPGPAPPQIVPDWLALPAITGTWRVGSELAATTGVWSPAADAYEYRWERCRGGDDGQECEVVGIAGATSRTYVLGAEDAGAWPQVQVRAHNAGGWSFWAESLLEHWGPVGEQLAGGPPASEGAPGTTSAPAIRALTLRPVRFHAVARGPAFGPGRGGARVTVLLSARPAALSFRVERRSGARWVARGGPVRVTPAAAMTTTVRLRFSGRVAGRRLTAGSYRLRVVTLDATGRASAARTARFTIVR